MNVLKFLAVGILVVSIAGCGGSDEKDAPTAVPSATIELAETSGTPAPGIAEQELGKTILAVEDIPAGYAKVGTDEDGTPSSYYCDYKPKYKQVMGIDRSFNREDIGFVNVSLRVFESVEAARDAMGESKAVLDGGCTEQSVDGEKYSFALVSVPSIGDQSYAVRADIESGGSVVNWYVLRGSAVLTVGGGGYSPTSIEDLQPLVDKQLAKFDAALAD